MASANVSLLKDFFLSIRLISARRDLIDLFIFSEKDFVRKRKIGFDDVCFCILGMLKKSLNVELFKLAECMPQSFTKSAFCQQRQKVDSRFFRFLLGYQAKQFYDSKLVRTWKNFKILAVDGSSAMLINNKEVSEIYHGGSNQYDTYCLGRYMKMYDVLNGITLTSELMSFDSSERSIAYQWVEELPDNSITLYDRGFPSYSLMSLMNSSEVPKSFVMRCKTGFNNSVKTFVEGRENDAILTFYPDYKAIATLKEHGFKVSLKTALKVRAVKLVLPSGITEVLLTNLIDKKKFPRRDLKKIYGMRWGVETAIGREKNLFQLENLSAHGLNEIEQDFYATFIVANMHAVIKRLSDRKVLKYTGGRKYQYQTNCSASLYTFKQALPLLYYSLDVEKIVKYLITIWQQFIEPVRPARQIKRVWRTRRRYGKHQTQTNYRNNL
jgi:hypothetical protein